MYAKMSGDKTIEMLRAVAKKTKSPIAEDLSKEADFQTACSVAHQLFDEALDAFKEGDMTWKEAIDDLSANLQAMEMPDSPKGTAESEGE